MEIYEYIQYMTNPQNIAESGPLLALYIFLFFLFIRFLSLRPTVKNMHKLEKSMQKEIKQSYVKKFWIAWLFMVLPGVTIAVLCVQKAALLEKLIPISIWSLLAFALLALAILSHLNCIATSIILLLRQRLVVEQQDHSAI